ncbi:MULTISPECIES: single-stranded DNA-binding protein [unclassified Candidatus Tisiphia]|uniref:Single-stranded DNA-binding protein n=1 Tax=Candidatus Tisiphia endosymbiont of Sergentomyia squamirostris TaxID=3113639 RepID=A0AAT9G8L3_9RICK|nr:single-stranded DNA-binding protein [Rickettsia sp.]MDR0774762.1 single-stranded DNA-binding protein [Rickettsia sp.]
MAGSLNKAVLIGNLGRDPEIRHTADGKEIANFSIATSETWKDRVTGEKKEKTEWHRIVVFNEGLVSVVKNYAKKGTKVYLEGNLQTRKWVDNLGQEKYTTEIVLQNFNSQFILLDSKGSGTNSLDSIVPKSTVGNSNFDHSDLDDEIPF